MFMNTVIPAVLIAFILTLFSMHLAIPLLVSLKMGQNIRKEGPESHRKKQGTPTFGGLIFISVISLTMLIFVRSSKSEGYMALLAMVSFGAIGLLDDALKHLNKKNQGLRVKAKLLLLLGLSLAFACYGYLSPTISENLEFGRLSLGHFIYLGPLFLPFTTLYFTFSANAVNLTDGLDGLATTVSSIVFGTLAYISYTAGHPDIALFCAISCGALLAFLCFNVYPAKVIMGDTGSIAIGGALAAIGMLLQTPLILIVVGGIYVIEAVSVLLQVGWFKLTGKRIFKMAPLHHSFELSGFHESQIVAYFSIATCIFCLLGFWIYDKI